MGADFSGHAAYRGFRHTVVVPGVTVTGFVVGANLVDSVDVGVATLPLKTPASAPTRTHVRVGRAAYW